MERFVISLVLVSLVSGCSHIQDAYDQQSISDCREWPNAEDRRACEQAAEDAAFERRVKDRAERND